ncbi:CIA30 family protein [Beauveria bassiana ARSEF 2860]|uniref:CIA30 family protein n=1 Tax=Beauveria bassiana (strain ARSEF 2860) TaxID=655819 RepID=J4KNV2_BEAB2|nr:CIA30 family protein [Beauveria bassiana ARSEF 2860]EJP66349.1 CIA30 family protein [Beauveria bassiana ARSEF 2860]
MPLHTHYLYGGEKKWDSALWTTSDDRVRGGSSQSYLTVSDADKTQASFHGHLDTSTLGGAGFASQHSRGELALDLSSYDGILISIAGPHKADGKRYVLTLKDELLPPRRDGRETSSISWEAEFVAEKPGDIKLPWKAFKATYRGRDKPDAKPLDLANIKRLGLMMRSFFDEQKGDFALYLSAIAAYKDVSAQGNCADADAQDDYVDLKSHQYFKQERKPWWKIILCGFV